MSCRVQIAPQVSKAISFCGLTREDTIRLLIRLHTEIADDAERCRNTRAQKDPACFIVKKVLRGLNGRDTLFTFFVNDQLAPGLLVVVGLVPKSRPSPP
jgi:hypothetical protein